MEIIRPPCMATIESAPSFQDMSGLRLKISNYLKFLEKKTYRSESGYGAYDDTDHATEPGNALYTYIQNNNVMMEAHKNHESMILEYDPVINQLKLSSYWENRHNGNIEDFKTTVVTPDDKLLSLIAGIVRFRVAKELAYREAEAAKEAKKQALLNMADGIGNGT